MVSLRVTRLTKSQLNNQKKKEISFKTCLKFSNSVCDLLIVSLQTSPSYYYPCLPPSFLPCKWIFEEISLKIHTYVMSLLSPLPNIIFLGDFNLPEINWSSLRTLTTCKLSNSDYVTSSNGRIVKIGTLLHYGK